MDSGICPIAFRWFLGQAAATRTDKLWRTRPSTKNCIFCATSLGTLSISWRNKVLNSRSSKVCWMQSKFEGTCQAQNRCTYFLGNIDSDIDFQMWMSYCKWPPLELMFHSESSKANVHESSWAKDPKRSVSSEISQAKVSMQKIHNWSHQANASQRKTSSKRSEADYLSETSKRMNRFLQTSICDNLAC